MAVWNKRIYKGRSSHPVTLWKCFLTSAWVRVNSYQTAIKSLICDLLAWNFFWLLFSRLAVCYRYIAPVSFWGINCRNLSGLPDLLTSIQNLIFQLFKLLWNLTMLFPVFEIIVPASHILCNILLSFVFFQCLDKTCCSRSVSILQD